MNTNIDTFNYPVCTIWCQLFRHSLNKLLVNIAIKTAALTMMYWCSVATKQKSRSAKKTQDSLSINTQQSHLSLCYFPCICSSWSSKDPYATRSQSPDLKQFGWVNIGSTQRSTGIAPMKNFFVYCWGGGNIQKPWNKWISACWCRIYLSKWVWASLTCLTHCTLFGGLQFRISASRMSHQKMLLECKQLHWECNPLMTALMCV